MTIKFALLFKWQLNIFNFDFFKQFIIYEMRIKSIYILICPKKNRVVNIFIKIL